MTISHNLLVIGAWSIVWAATAALVALDASRCGESGWRWGAVAFVTWPIGPLVWIVRRFVRAP